MAAGGTQALDRAEALTPACAVDSKYSLLAVAVWAPVLGDCEAFEAQAKTDLDVLKADVIYAQASAILWRRQAADGKTYRP